MSSRFLLLLITFSIAAPLGLAQEPPAPAEAKARSVPKRAKAGKVAEKAKAGKVAAGAEARKVTEEAKAGKVAEEATARNAAAKADAAATGKAPAAEAKAKTKAPVDPAIDATLGELLDAVDQIAAMGRAADRELTRARRRLKVRSARPILYILGRRIRKKPAPDPRPELEAIKALCKKTADLAGKCVRFGSKALPAAAKRVEKEAGLRKEIMEVTHRQLYDQIALEEMGTYLEGNRSSGTFDGMFPTTASYGDAGTQAFLRVLLDMDHPNELRVLAAEGVAQLGKTSDKELIEELRRVQEDTMEEAPVRSKVEMVLARLGDRKLFNEKLAQYEKALKDAKDKLKASKGPFEKARDEYVALPADTPAEEKKALEKKLNELFRPFVNSAIQVGRVANFLAWHFQGLRTENATVAKWYGEQIGAWNLVQNQVWNSPQLKSQMAGSFYNLACVLSLDKKFKPAMRALENSFRWGYANYKWARRDGDLAFLRTKPEFEKLVKECESGAAMKRWQKEARERQAAARKAAEEAAKKKAEAEGDGAKAGTDTKPSSRPAGDGPDGQ